MNFSKIKIKNKRYTIRLGESLFLRVYPSGSKSYVLRYAKGGKVRDITLGKYPDLSLLQAKQAAHLKREELKIKPSVGLTFKDAFKLWCNKKKGHIVSYEAEKHRIELYLFPKLKKMQLDKITAPFVLNLLIEFNDRLPTLKRLLMRINEILELAVCAGLLLQNPCRRLSRVFAEHHAINRAFIPAERLGEFFILFRGKSLYMHCFALWAVYSMLRPIESVSIQWSWIENEILTLPSEIMKKRRPHRVPLCPPVIALLKFVRTIVPKKTKYVWSCTSSVHLHKQHLTRFLNQSALKGQLCHHGLRATARTWLRDEKVPYEIAEDCLAHLSGSQTERAYLRGDYLEQRKPIYSKWWSYIFSLYCASCAGDYNATLLIQAVIKK